MRLSAYARELKEPEKSRYADKVRLCGGVDPFDFQDNEVVRDISLLPRVDLTDIKDYLVDATSFVSREQFKSQKAMDGHNYLTSGWMQEPVIKVLADSRVILVAKVHHSQSFSKKLLTPWLLLKEDGEVLAAHCTCMAGLGEACSHIGAVLYYVAAVVSRRDGQVCTDKANAWLPPQVRFLDGKEACKVGFESSKMKKRIMDGEQPVRKLQQSPHVKEATDDEWSSFLSACHQSGSRPALLSLKSEYAEDFVPVATKFPEVILSSMQQDEEPSTWTAVMEQCTQLAKSISIEKKVASFVEKQTQEQAKCGKWFAVRAGRVTASNAKAVCRTSTTNPSLSLVRKICYPEDVQFWSPQTAWGKQHEQKAREAYIAVSQDIHVNFLCRGSGLHISLEHPFMAASPDGLISCTCCGKGVIEIKCPFNGREEPARKLATSKSACISIVNDKVVLKKDHSYYYQVQMQMLVCQVEHCDFILWTRKDFIVIRVYKDAQFCMQMAERCKLYFSLVLLPELCFRYWTNEKHDEEEQEHNGGKHGEETPDPNSTTHEAQEHDEETQDPESTLVDEVYCFCRKPESGKMVMCDSKTCKHVWYHYKCVNLKRAPRTKKWYCPECLLQSKKA